MGIELLAGQPHRSESGKAIIACNDWLALGIGRSLPCLLEGYANTAPDAPKPPTKSISTLKSWSSDYKWEERAKIYDAEIEARKEKERQRVFSEGIALDYERVRKLMRLADFLEAEVYRVDADGKHSNVWLPDVKSIGSGDNAQRVDLVRFNPAIIQQLRETLDDIAQETGGRKRNVEVGTKNDKPLKIQMVEVVVGAAVAGDDPDDPTDHD